MTHGRTHIRSTKKGSQSWLDNPRELNEALPGNQVMDWIQEQLCYGSGLPRFPLYNTPLNSLVPVLEIAPTFSDLALLLDTSSLALPSEASSCLTLSHKQDRIAKHDNYVCFSHVRFFSRIFKLISIPIKAWGDSSVRRLLALRARDPEFHPQNPCQKSQP